MLKRLYLKQFTVFREADFDFSPRLNVIIGDNGTGKTHVLKLGYLFCRAWTDLNAERKMLAKKRVESYLERRLEGIFRVQDIANLISHKHRNGAAIAADIGGHIPTVRIHMPHEAPRKSPGLDEDMPWEIRLNRPKEQPGQVEVIRLPEEAAINAFVPRPIFVPSKEIVSLFKGLIGLFETYRGFPLDDTYRDLAVALTSLEPAEPSPLLPEVAQRIHDLLKGDLRLENNELVFLSADGDRLESHLMAEGHRKLAMLVYLVRYRLVELGSTLFWDEPEANLNPSAIRLLAESLHTLAKSGVQVIVATHSLFLLREFEILAAREKETKTCHRYFALKLTKKGVSVSVGDDIAEVDPLVLLDEDLAQSDRYLETLP